MSYEFIYEVFWTVLPISLVVALAFCFLGMAIQDVCYGKYGIILNKKAGFFVFVPSILFCILSAGYLFSQGPSEKINGLFGIEIGRKFIESNEYTQIRQGNIEREVLSEYHSSYEADGILPTRDISIKVNPIDGVIHSIAVKFIYSSEESLEKGYEVLQRKLKEKLKNSFLYSADYFDGDVMLKIRNNNGEFVSVYSVVIEVKSLKLEGDFERLAESYRETNKSINIDAETERTRELAESLI